MKVGEQIPWNVTPICETSQIYHLMGERPMKDVLGLNRAQTQTNSMFGVIINSRIRITAIEPRGQRKDNVSTLASHFSGVVNVSSGT